MADVCDYEQKHFPPFSWLMGDVKKHRRVCVCVCGQCAEGDQENMSPGLQKSLKKLKHLTSKRYQLLASGNWAVM